MIFDQKKDGSCDIIFSKEEIMIIKEHKKIYLNDESLRHFSNNLVKICIEFQNKFNEKTKNLTTTPEDKIKGLKPKK